MPLSRSRDRASPCPHRVRCSRECVDFTCPDQNEPVRTIFAIAWASLRSILSGIVLVAALSPRASISTMGGPARMRPA